MAENTIKMQLREVKVKTTALREQIKQNKEALKPLKIERDRLKAELGASAKAETVKS